jgi:NDP-sugar pyrophosphorylase family protein
VFAWSHFFSGSGWNLWREEEPVWAVLHRMEEILRRSTFQRELEIPKGSIVEGDVALGAGTILEPGVYIQGPCVIGHASEVKNSILFEGAQVAHLNYVGDSILGKNVNLGAGVKCANVRFDRREIRVAKISTGLKKFGSIIGDRSQIGCNVVLNPGTLVGKDCFSYPLLNLQGVIPPRSRIRGKADEVLLEPLEIEILEALR